MDTVDNVKEISVDYSNKTHTPQHIGIPMTPTKLVLLKQMRYNDPINRTPRQSVFIFRFFS